MVLYETLNLIYAHLHNYAPPIDVRMLAERPLQSTVHASELELIKE